MHCLQEISSQILLQDQGEDTLEAKEKVHVISNKLRLLIRQTAHDLHTLQSRLVRFIQSHTHKHKFSLQARWVSLSHTEVLVLYVLLQDSPGPNVGRTASTQQQVQKHSLQTRNYKALTSLYRFCRLTLFLGSLVLKVTVNKGLVRIFSLCLS